MVNNVDLFKVQNRPFFRERFCPANKVQNGLVTRVATPLDTAKQLLPNLGEQRIKLEGEQSELVSAFLLEIKRHEVPSWRK